MAIVNANPELKRILDLLESGAYTPNSIGDAKPVVDRLLSDGEHFLVLADFYSYMAAQARVDALYVQPDAWSRMALLNTLCMGPFSSDRSIRDYADRIWNIKPVL
jgi:starch phosphorylase